MDTGKNLTLNTSLLSLFLFLKVLKSNKKGICQLFSDANQLVSVISKKGSLFCFKIQTLKFTHIYYQLNTYACTV